MNRAYLSRNDIEQIAKRVIETYKSVAVPQKHLCYVVDPVELADVLGLQVDFQYLTKDGSILGLTTPEEALIPVLDMDSNPFLYHLDGRTVLVEQRLDNLPRFRGRRNFTIAHEIAHQILYRLFPDAYGMQRRTLCDYRRSSKPCKQISCEAISRSSVPSTCKCCKGAADHGGFSVFYIVQTHSVNAQGKSWTGEEPPGRNTLQ